MPAEWHPHQSCWMIWPKRDDVWRHSAIFARKVFSQIALAIAPFEPVRIAVAANLMDDCKSYFPHFENTHLIPIESNDAWARDIAPTIVINKQGDLCANHWGFNAWGGLYEQTHFDEKLPIHIANYEQIPIRRINMILEGGSIHSDGNGTLLVTEECLLNPNRNPDLSKQEIEDLLKYYLGAQQCIWLPFGVYNDETSGHIDNMACFLAPNIVALTWSDDINDPQYERSLAAYDILHDAGLTIHKIQQPETQYSTIQEAQGWSHKKASLQRKARRRLAASYINFYMANNAIILPQFNCPQDQKALDFFRSFYPERHIIPIYSREILLGGGNIHCITQQIPQPLTAPLI